MEIKDYKDLFEQSSALIVVMDINFTIIAVSDEYIKVAKTTRENIVGSNIFDVYPDNPNDQNAEGSSKIRTSLNLVLKHKTTDILGVVKYDIPKIKSDDGGRLKYWRFHHSPVVDENNKVRFIIQRVEDVTESETLTALLEIEKKALKKTEDSEKRYNLMLMKSPFAFAVFKGKEMVITLANDSIKKIWGKGSHVEGKPLFEVLPELNDTPFPGLLDSVYTTGIPYYRDEHLAQFQREDKLEDAYFNFIYQPYLEADETISGVTVIVYEVTAQVLVKKALAEQREAEKKALKQIEESNKRYHMMLMESRKNNHVGRK